MYYIKRITFVIIILVFFQLFSFQWITKTHWGWIQNIVLIYLVGWVFLVKKTTKSGMHFKPMVYCFMLIPLLSMLPCYFVHGQSFMQSLYIQRIQFFWIFYFVLHYWRIDEKFIIYFIIITGISWAIIQLLQQFTYPLYYFGTRGDDLQLGKEIEIRAGVYRFMVTGVQLGILTLFITWEKLNAKFQLKSFLILSFALVGIFLYMTRQIMASSVASLIISMLIQRSSKYRVLIIVMLVVGLYILYIYSDMIFGSLIDSTTNDLYENVRFQSYYYYFFEHWEGWITYLFGNGYPNINSSYGQYVKINLEQDMGLFCSDIGIIGEYSQYGIVYILCFIISVYYIIKKVWKKIRLYQKMYMIYALLIIPMIFPFRSGSEYIFMSMFLYLCDISINKYNVHKYIAFLKV